MTFREYLQGLHAEQYTGVDDDMPDDFDNWLEKFDQNEIIDLAEKYGKELLKLSGIKK